LQFLQSRQRELAGGLDSDDFPGDRADQAEAIERLSELESIRQRIVEVTWLLASRTEPDGETPPDQVGGSIVTLRYADATTEVLRVGTVVEDDDGKVVTPDSPLGHALLGRSAGQHISWPAPAGHSEATVVQVSQPPA
jgi:transcription elongation factor GreA